MSAIQTFETKAAAQDEVSKMQGWNTQIVDVQREGFHADDYDGNGELIVDYVICCNGNLHLMEDGFVN